MVDLTDLGHHLLGQIELGKLSDQWFHPVAPIQGKSLEATEGCAPDQDPDLRIGVLVQQV
jgi:hypothetical protein